MALPRPAPLADPPPERQPYCQLAPAEIAELGRSGELLIHYRDLVYRLEEAQRLLWWRLRNTYQLADELDYDPATGQIYQEAPGLPVEPFADGPPLG